MTSLPDGSIRMDAVADRLRARLPGPLPGTRAHLLMAPEYRQDPNAISTDGKTCREAAVLALLVPVEDTPAVVLTLRPSHLPHHAGQVSFPGGSREPGESLLETALREAREEVGLADEVEVLGPLSPLYIPPTAFCVYPFVAVCPHPPDLIPYEAEVEAILHVPISQLLDPATRRREQREVRGTLAWVPFYTVGPYEIWGATAMILAELLLLLEPET